MLTTLITAAAFAAALPHVCSVRELRRSPGHQWSVERIHGFVDSADVIVVARAVAPDRVSIIYRDSTTWWPGVRFETLDVLRGGVPERLVLWGDTVSSDDYNAQPVPYQTVRSSGQHGDCYASEYKIGALYLLLLRRQRGELTARWAPLAPLNEQVRDKEDPWVQWVRQRIGQR